MFTKNLQKFLALVSCLAAITKLGHGETYTKIPPLPKIRLANFATSNETFVFNTGNAAGIKTFWEVKLSISKNGIVTGSAVVENYDTNGNLVGKPKLVNIAQGSKISAPATITPINLRSVDEDGGQIQQAVYPSNLLVKFSNGFIIGGKRFYQHYLNIYPMTSTLNNGETIVTGYNIYDNTEQYIHVSITGPDGHIGFIEGS